MKINHLHFIKIIYFFSFIEILSLFATIILLVVFQMTGFTQPVTPPPSLSSYSKNKLELSNIALNANIITTSLALFTLIIMLVLINRYTIHIKAERQQNYSYFYTKIMSLSSLQMLLLLANFLRAIDLLFINNQYQFMKKDHIIIVLLMGTIIITAGFLKWIFVFRYILQINKAKDKIYTIDTIQREQQIFQVYEKNYMTNMTNLIRNPKQLKQTSNIQDQSLIYQIIRSNLNKIKSDKNQIGQQQIKKGFKLLSKFQNNNSSQKKFKLLGGRKKADQKSQQSNIEQDNQNILKIEQQLILSQKFDENNFELEQSLLKQIATDQEEDLSPYELNELMRFTKNNFELNKNTQNNLVLSKEYNPLKIVVHFLKIKKFKAGIQKNKVNYQQKHIKNQQLQKQQVRHESQEPINAQVSILLKTILFNNSPFYIKKQPTIQKECPIQKYIDADFNLQIEKIDTNKKDKDKKREFQQTLIFQKKNKNNFEQNNADYLSKLFTDLYQKQVKSKMSTQDKQDTRVKNVKQTAANQYNTKNPLKRQLIHYIRGKYEG